MKEKDEIQQKGDQLVAQYVKQLDQLGRVNANLQKQISQAVQPTVPNGTCTITNGFVRLYNASANGSATSPSSVDGTASGVDAATLLDVLIANNIKYNEVADQLIKLQQFEKTNP